MIKVITIITKFIVTALIALLFSSCHHVFTIGDGIKGSGKITTETRSVTQDFKSIEVSSGIKVIVEQSNTQLITVETDENLQKHIITKVENGVLIIECDESYNSESPVVNVKMPVINRLSASSGSEIANSKTLISDKIDAKSSSGSTININVEADLITLESSSGSTTSVYPIIKLNAKASSGSSIYYSKAPKTISKEESSGGSVKQR